MALDIEELKAAAELYGIAFFDAIPDSFLDSARELPVSWARSKALLPISVDGRDFLLMSSADDIEALERASRSAGCRFEPALAPRGAILDAINKKLSSSGAGRSPAGPQAGAVGGAVPPPPQAVPAAPPPAELFDGDSATAADYVDAILLQAVKEGASDIHIEPNADGVAVRFRIDGILHRRASPPPGLEQATVSRLKVMAGMDISEHRLPQDGMAEAKVGNRAIDIRVSAVPVAYGERLVLRLLNRGDAFLPLGDLGMDAGMQEGFRWLVSKPNGIVAISGPTGSGKTTTLYAALGEMDSSRRNILTIEDPVEYRLPGVGQMQVKPKIGLTFASGLRHMLRQDPDVILVGETRDPETAEIAVRASLTGHLVLTTLHTNDAPSAVVRLVDMGVAPYLVASSLRGVLAQRLVRKLCPHCRHRAAPAVLPAALAGAADPDLLERLSLEGCFAPTGCDACLDGFRGRMGIFELMVCNDEVASLVREGVTDAAMLRQAAGRSGFGPMADDAVRKVIAGDVDLREVAGVLA